MKPYKLAVVIGRFQPVHKGHQALFEKAKEVADEVLILVGSSQSPRTPKNPFTFEERKELLTQVLEGVLSTFPSIPYSIQPLLDNPYREDAWVQSVKTKVATSGLLEDEIAIIGHRSDASSYYLDLFPYKLIKVKEAYKGIHASDIRKGMFKGSLSAYSDYISPSTLLFISNFMKKSDFFTLLDEFIFYEKHNKAWSNVPYPPIFQTVDALVEFDGNVLLVERGKHPGKGLLALPGGYLDTHESLGAATLRELKEETQLRVTDDRLKHAQVGTKTFDFPGRSIRGRIITQVTHFFLDRIPYTKAADDAAACVWMHVDDMKPEEFFEDHYFIIKEMLEG